MSVLETRDPQHRTHMTAAPALEGFRTEGGRGADRPIRQKLVLNFYRIERLTRLRLRGCRRLIDEEKLVQMEKRFIQRVGADRVIAIQKSPGRHPCLLAR